MNLQFVECPINYIICSEKKKFELHYTKVDIQVTNWKCFDVGNSLKSQETKTVYKIK